MIRFAFRFLVVREVYLDSSSLSWRCPLASLCFFFRNTILCLTLKYKKGLLVWSYLIIWLVCNRCAFYLSPFCEVPLKMTLWRCMWSNVLTPRPLDLEVRGSNLARRVASLDKKLYSTLFLFSQVYKWVLATYCWGVTLRWTSIPSHTHFIIINNLLLHKVHFRPQIAGESSNILRLASCYGNRDKLRLFGPLARAPLYLFLLWKWR